jgi:uncharacterized protein YndB with AHSA1/START domain
MPTLESAPALSLGRSLSLQFNRRIPATSSQVFAAWTDPDLLKAWFAPGNMTIPEVSRDLREGGRYRIEMMGTMAVHNGEEALHSEDPSVVAQGVYTRLVPGSQLAYTWTGSWNPEEKSHVTVSFFEGPSGTTLTLDHTGFHSEQSLQVHRSGWQSSLAKLRELFSRN